MRSFLKVMAFAMIDTGEDFMIFLMVVILVIHGGKELRRHISMF